MQTVSERLTTGRHQQFIGREPERLLFEKAIAAPVLPFLLLHIYGPGGIGKSALLREFAAQCQQAQVAVVTLEARDIEPSPASFLAALRQALALPDDADPAAFLAAQDSRYVLLIDTYEEIHALDGWIRDTFCPSLPADCLTVLAGRYPPTVGWTSDSAWSSLLNSIALRNLSLPESRIYLARQNVPPVQHQSILDFTHGHPLALSLAADACRQREDFVFAPEALPDVIQTLLNRFLQTSLSTVERAGLEIAAVVRVTTEPLLAEMLPDADARALFDWLRGLSFIETGRCGLFPHELAREVLCADLRWRNPDRYADWNRKARQYYNRRMHQASVQEQQNVLANYLYLFHDDPIVRPFFDWSDIGGYTDALRPTDIPALLRMTTQFEGKDAAHLAAYWLMHPAGRTHVVRSSQHGSAHSEPLGFLTGIALHEIGEPERRRDPITAAAWQHLAQTAPLRSGEQAMLFRFWMASDTYQAVSEIQSLILMNVIRLQLTTPGMAYAVLLCVSPDFWRPIAEFAEMPRVAGADCEINGQMYGFYEHDWRIMPPAAWLDMLAERMDGLRPYFDAPTAAAPPLAVLTHAAFSEAVSDALRFYAQPDGLRQNPLLRTRCVVAEAGHQAGERDRIESLRLLVREAIEELQSPPRLARQYRALHRTYLQPVGSQTDAAELLDLPFSTYRRHLTEGVASVVAALWQQEITGEK